VRAAQPVPKPPAQTGTPAQIQTGEVKFTQECSRCHVFGPSVTPDLRKLDPTLHGMFEDIVLRGAVAPTGMERFDDLLSATDVEAIHAYLIEESWKAYREQEEAEAPKH
jgi:quinohemoprotein ethanol dehydrogenase